MTRVRALFTLAAALAGAALAGACAQLIGADFDVTAAGADSGADAGSDAHDSGPTCAEPPCVETVAAGQDFPWGIAVSGGWVYWATVGTAFEDGGEPLNGGRVLRAPAGGGAPEILADHLYGPNQVFATADHTYFTRTMKDGGVYRVAVDGGALEPIAVGQYAPIGVTVDGASVYWTTSDGFVKWIPLAEVGSAPDAGILAATPNGPGLLVSDGQRVFWTEIGAAGGVNSIGVDGSAPLTLASMAGANGIALAGPFVAFATFNTPDGVVGQVSKTFVGAQILASSQKMPAGIAADLKDIYWACYEGGTVQRVTIGGGTPELLADGQASPNGIALDDDYVYWTNRRLGAEGGAVMRRRKNK